MCDTGKQVRRRKEGRRRRIRIRLLSMRADKTFSSKENLKDLSHAKSIQTCFWSQLVQKVKVSSLAKRDRISRIIKIG